MPRKYREKYFLIITCEHAGFLIPLSIKKEVKIPLKILRSHEGFDAGASEMAFYLKKNFNGYFQMNNNTRLILDYNRSLTNPAIWGRYAQSLSPVQRDKLIDDYQLYRKKIINCIESQLKRGAKVLHIAVHSFTPKLHGKKRNADIGLLYDSSRKPEKKLAIKWKEFLSTFYRVRLNYPYLGKADGLTTHLRKKFKKDYFGFELEMNQNLFQDKAEFLKLKKIIGEGVNNLLE